MQKHSPKETFQLYSRRLETSGVRPAPGALPRVLIPKTDLSKKSLKTLGFQPVFWSVPELGQKRWTSYRHPLVNYHLHDHGKYWSMHRDRTPALTMLLERHKIISRDIPYPVPVQPKRSRASFKDSIKHLTSEGYPAVKRYIVEKLNHEPRLIQRLRNKQQQKTAAVGIPNRQIITTPSPVKYQTWQMTIHKHAANRAGDHYDLRLVDPRTNKAHSWALRNLPTNPGDKTLAVQQPDHTEAYTHFEGKIKDGYGAGEVRIHQQVPVEILEITPGKILFNVYKGKNVEKYALIRTSDKNWLYYNYTPTSKSLPIPNYKFHYKKLKPSQIDFHNTQELLAPKYDGASAIIYLRGGKPINVFSYRPSKNGKSDLIDHTYRTELYKIRAPKTLHDTILRAELFARKNNRAIPAPQTGGILNANVWKSRQLQAQKGKLDNIIYDIVKFRGRNVEDIPYAQKIRYLQTVSQKIPQLRVPPLAESAEEKQALYAKILAGKSPETSEGFIVYNKLQPQPKKAKITADYDVYVRDFYPGTGRLRNSIGGFRYSLTPNGPIIGRVGGGFSDQLRRSMAANPQNYKGRIAKITAQSQYPSGAFRMPIFKEWRTAEKWPEKTAEDTSRASLKDHYRYGRYLLGHKWNVLKAGRELNVPLGVLLKHDNSKLRPSEWAPYVEWFYGPRGLKGSKDPTVRKEFLRAVELHHSRNHHHDYKTRGSQLTNESIADWYSVYKTQNDLAGKKSLPLKIWMKENAITKQRR